MAAYADENMNFFAGKTPNNKAAGKTNAIQRKNMPKSRVL